MGLVLPRVRHLRRYQQIASVFARYGFREWAERRGGATLFQEAAADDAAAPDAVASQRSGPQRLRLAFETLGPTFIKLGQILSTRPDLLPAEYIAELERLQDSAAPLPWEEVRRALETELERPLEEAFAFVEITPLASASLAQVHAARLLSGEDAVVKIQRPGIVPQIDQDLEILEDLTPTLAALNVGNGWVDLVSAVQDFSATLREELDYEIEAQNLETFRSNFRGDVGVRIPRLHWELCTPRLMVLERLRGIKITDVHKLDAAGYDRHAIASRAARIVIKEMLQDGFFHADPHPGNLVVLPGEVIGIMDFGMVGRLTLRLRLAIANLFVALANQEPEQAVERLIQTGIAPPEVDRGALAAELGRVLRRYHGRRLRQMSGRELFAELQPILQAHDLRVPAELWLLLKTLLMMQGVGTTLDPDFNLFADAKPFLVRLALYQWSPAAVQESLLRTSINLGDMLNTGPEVLRKLEQGELRLRYEVVEPEKLARSAAPLVDRLAVAIVLAALIVGLGLLLPQLGADSFWLRALAGTFFALFVLLGAWFITRVIR